MPNQYIGVNGVARKVNNSYIGVNGVARKVNNSYIGVNGVARKSYSSDRKLILYDNGKEYQGGWRTGYHQSYCGTFTRYDTYMKVTGGSANGGGECGCCTVNKINLTDYRKICVELLSATTSPNPFSGYSGTGLIVCSSKAPKYADAEITWNLYTQTNGILTQDISAINQSVYIYILGNHGGGILNVKKVWLE